MSAAKRTPDYRQTPYCQHPEDDWCDHCEFGCKLCGALDMLTSRNVCPACVQADADFAEFMTSLDKKAL